MTSKPCNKLKWLATALKPGTYRFSLTLPSGSSAPNKIVYSSALMVAAQ